jgi:hypothetical protein
MSGEAPAIDRLVENSGDIAGESRLRPIARVVLVALWLAGLAFALGALWHYKMMPGVSASTPLVWPRDTHIVANPGTPTLVLFAHPKCPCTRASLTELRGLLSRFGGQVTSYVTFLHPHETRQDWSRTDSWSDANSIPGVYVLPDADGEEATRFGVTTSGHVVLYSARGKLLFSGGITPTRGHVGESPQLQRLVRMLESETGTRRPTEASTLVSAPVFGCPLQDHNNETR